MYRFNLFTAKANEALNLAVKSAQTYGHNYIGTEHLLIGLVRENENFPTFADNSISLTKIDAYIRDNIGVGNQTRLTPDDFTPRAKRVIEISFQVAKSMHRSFVTTEHILISVLKEGDSFAVKMIKDFGVSVDRLIDELINNASTVEQLPDYQSVSKKKQRAKHRF